MDGCVWERVYRLCVQLGLSSEDAQDCVTEVILRYKKRTGTFPQEEKMLDIRLLRLLVRDVVCEYRRTFLRHQKLEQEYLAQQRQQQTTAPTPMAIAIANLDCERFRDQLPDYLQRVLHLMEVGYTPKEIALCLEIAVSTVYKYKQELRQRFVEFFGYDPRKSEVRVGNYIGRSETGDSDDT